MGEHKEEMALVKFAPLLAADCWRPGEPVKETEQARSDRFRIVVMRGMPQPCSETSSVFIIRPTAQRYGILAKISWVFVIFGEMEPSRTGSKRDKCIER
jgi:hypothetical protein